MTREQASEIARIAMLTAAAVQAADKAVAIAKQAAESARLAADAATALSATLAATKLTD